MFPRSYHRARRAAARCAILILTMRFRNLFPLLLLSGLAFAESHPVALKAARLFDGTAACWSRIGLGGYGSTGAD